MGMCPTWRRRKTMEKNMKRKYGHGTETEWVSYSDGINGTVEFCSFRQNEDMVLTRIMNLKGREVWARYIHPVHAFHFIQICEHGVGGVCYAMEVLMD